MSGNTLPKIMHPIVYPVPLVTASEPPTHALEAKQCKGDNNDYLIKVSHGASIRVLAPARRTSSHAAKK